MKTKNRFTIIGVVMVITFLCGCVTENKIAHKRFISGYQKVLVCPVHILTNQNSSFDTISSKKIVDYINAKEYAFASRTQLSPPINNEWGINEAKMLTVSINYFIDFVKEINLPEDTYILYPEFLKRGQNVHAIHYCLLNNKGEVAMRGLLNSIWKEFQTVKPKTNEDCVQVFINGFENKMAE
ncbi:MAG: hypothetical protein KAH68_08330 [Draconibacterium sp.]|nr:hypothetical protein [Draconibacterium sp.]